MIYQALKRKLIILQALDNDLRRALVPIISIILVLMLSGLVNFGSNTSSVKAQSYFSDNFDDGNANGWTQQLGSWAVKNGEYCVSVGTVENGISTVNGLNLTDCLIETQLRFTDASGYEGGIVFRYSDNSHYYAFQIGHEYDHMEIITYDASNPDYGNYAKRAVIQPLFGNNSIPINLNVEYTLRIEIQGTNFNAYFNGQHVLSWTDNSYSSGLVGLRARNAGVVFDNFIIENATASPTPTPSQSPNASPSPNPSSTPKPYNLGFYGQYEGTFYSISPPSSKNYDMNYFDGGTLQTYYGLFNRTTLETLSNYQFSGTMNGFNALLQTLDTQTYYDIQNRPISSYYKQVITLDNQVQSSSVLHEYGNYQGHYAVEDDFVAASIGQQFTNVYDQRNYINGNYNDTSHITDQIKIIDSPTKIVQAGTYATVHIEEIKSVNRIQNTKTERYISKDIGQTIYLETYQFDQNSWTLLVTRELVSKTQSSLTPNPSPTPRSTTTATPNIPEFPSLLILMILVGLISLSIVTIRKRSKNLSRASSG